jgi:hypothetical protein
MEVALQVPNMSTYMKLALSQKGGGGREEVQNYLMTTGPLRSC